LSFKGGVEDLKRVVLDQGLCTVCGACVNLCLYIDMVGGKAVITELCGLKEGKCYAFCPRIHIDIPSLDERIFGSCRQDLAVGYNKSILKARAKDPEISSVAQYGGVVSALMTYALESGEIDAAVLAKSHDGISPEPAIARNWKEVLECSRSKYLVCPTVSGVVKALMRARFTTIFGKQGFMVSDSSCPYFSSTSPPVRTFSFPTIALSFSTTVFIMTISRKTFKKIL